MLNIILSSTALLLSVFGLPFFIASRKLLIIRWKMELYGLKRALNVILSQGKSGENAVNRIIAKIIRNTPQLNDAMTFEGDIVLLNGNGNLSQEIDHIIITRFAIIVIETKEWYGRISTLDDHTALLDQDGRIERRKSPYAQAQSKQVALSKILGKETPIAFVCVFTNPDIEFAPNCPSNYFHISQFGEMIKKVHQNCHGREVIDIQSAYKKIKARCDGMPNAKMRHLARIAKNTKNPTSDALTVLDYDTKIVELQQKIADPSYKPTISEHISKRVVPVFLWILLTVVLFKMTLHVLK